MYSIAGFMTLVGMHDGNYRPGVKALLDEAYCFLKSQGSYREMFNADFEKGMLPEVSLQKVEEASRFASSLRERIKVLLTDESLGHYDVIALKTLDYYCKVNLFIGGCENPVFPDLVDLNFAVAPNNSPLFFMNEAAKLDISASRENSLRYLRLMDQYPRLAGDCLERTLHQSAKGIYIPANTLQYTLSGLRNLARPGVDNPLWLLPERLHPSVEDREETAAAANQSLCEAIEVLNTLIAHLSSEEYFQQAPKHSGLKQYPGGAEYYRRLVDYHCGSGVDYNELYTFAVERLEQLESRMESVLSSLGYHCTGKEFFNEIAPTLPELYDNTPEEVERRYTRYLDRIRPHLSDFFEKIPQADCKVERMPVENEDAGTGYFAAPTFSQPIGRFLYNGKNLEKQNQVWSGALVYHELLPGHHFQMSLTLENKNLHPFFRSLYYITGYGEGWADYASFLAEEMGLYDNPMDMLGRLYNDVRHTLQIPIDLGLNAFDWSDEKAIKFYKSYLGADDAKCASEISRFGNDIQGQGLGYSYGCYQFTRLRKKAEDQLGRLFSLPEFHTCVLELGATPFAVLEEHVDWFIANKLKGSQS